MIKAIITDVDGVIVGTKIGVNFPLPKQTIIEKLKAVNKSGMPIVLCTGKSSFAIEEIIRKAELDNPHITDAGALIYNPLRNQIIKEHVIEKNLASDIIRTCLEDNVYLELHTSKDYFIQKDQIIPLTEIRTAVLQKDPVIVDSLIEAAVQTDVIKILAFIKDESGKPRVAKLLAPFDARVDAIWSTVPFMLPAMARVLTIKDVSKMHASEDVMKYLGISFDECLGIGDLPADWKFIKLCKYAAALGDIDSEFKAHILSKGEGNYFLAPSADDDGFLDILEHFKL